GFPGAPRARRGALHRERGQPRAAAAQRPHRFSHRLSQPTLPARAAARGAGARAARPAFAGVPDDRRRSLQAHQRPVRASRRGCGATRGGAAGTAECGGRLVALPGADRRAQPHRDVAERGHVGLIHVIALLLACAFFLLIHFVVSGTRLRDALVARLGEGPYLGVFSLASLAGLLWMIHAYAHAPVIELWGRLPRLRPVAFVVVFVGVLFVVVGLASANPTSVGMEGRLARGAEGVRGITRITRHPFLWGVSLWALVHLTVNGDLAALVLFGSLLLLALAGTTVI